MLSNDRVLYVFVVESRSLPSRTQLVSVAVSTSSAVSERDSQVSRGHDRQQDSTLKKRAVTL